MRYFRHILAAAVVGAAVFAGVWFVPRTAQCADDPAWKVDEHGRKFRVAFNPHDRYLIEYGLVGSGLGGSGLGGSGLGGGELVHRVHAAWKTTFGLDFDDEKIWWYFRNTFADLDLRWTGNGISFRPTAVSAQYLRHDENSFVVIPSARNIKFPAPFDMGVEFTLARFDPSQAPGSDFVLNGVDVADISVLFEFIRDPDYRHRLALSPTATYRTWRVSDDPSDAWQHQMVPLTGVEALYAWESVNGRYQFSLRGRWARAITAHPSGEWDWQTRWHARGHAEIIVLSLNDLPVSIPLDVEIDQRGAEDFHWQAAAGLRVSFGTED